MGTLLPGTQEGYDGTFDVKERLPRWVEDIFELVETFKEIDEEDGVEFPKEVVANSDLLIQLLENISLTDKVDIHSSEA